MLCSCSRLFFLVFFIFINSCALPPKEKIDKQKAAKLNVELGLYYLEQKQIARAKSKFNRAKILAPTLSEVYSAYGCYWEEVAEPQEAEKAYQKAIYLNHKEGSAHRRYGAFLCRQHRYEQAEKEFLLAIKDPYYTKTAETLENMALCFLENAQKEKAILYLNKSLRYDPQRKSAQHLLVEIQRGIL